MVKQKSRTKFEGGDVMIHETVFCKNPKLAGLVTFLNFAGCAYQHSDLNEQYREYKKSALAGTRNGQASIYRSICIEKLH